MPTHVLLLSLIDDPFDPIGGDRIGGGQLFLFDLSRYLVRNGFRVTFVTRRNSPSKPEVEVLSRRFSIHRLAIGPAAVIENDLLANQLDAFERAVDAVVQQAGRVDVIHSYHWTAGEVARRIAAAQSIRHVHSVLSLGRQKTAPTRELSGPRAIRDRAEVEIFRSSATLLVTCPSEAADAMALYPEAGQPAFTLIPHGVDPNVFHPHPESADDYVRRAAHRFQQGADDLS